MRWLILAIFVYPLAVLQTSLFDPARLGFHFFQAPARPDLLLVLALLAALVAEPWQVFVAAWCLGLIEDLLIVGSRPPLGIAAILLALVAWAVAEMRGTVEADRPLTQATLALVMVLIIRPLQQVVGGWLFGPSHPGLVYVLEQTAGDALYTALLAPLVLWLVAKAATRRGAIRSQGG